MTAEQIRAQFLARLREANSGECRLTTRILSLDDGQVATLRRQLEAVNADDIGAEVVLERVTIASDIPLVRNFYGDEYTEILDIAGAQLDWLRSGNAPMQWYSHYAPMSHGQAGHVGNLRNPAVEQRGENNFLVADFVFFPNRERSREALEDVISGLTRNVSVGWSANDDGIEVTRVETADGNRQTLVVFRTWRPDETTWVAVPADRFGAGIGRADTPHHPPNRNGEAAMPTRNTNPGETPPTNPAAPRADAPATPATPETPPTAPRAENPAAAPAPAPAPAPESRSVAFAIIPGDQQLRAREQLRRAGVPDADADALLARAAENSNNGFASRGDFATATLELLDQHQRASQPNVQPGGRAPAVHVERTIHLGRILQDFYEGDLTRQNSRESELWYGEMERIGAPISGRVLTLPPRFLAAVDARTRMRMINNLAANPRTAPYVEGMNRAAVSVSGSQDGVFTPELDESDLIMALYDVFGVLPEIPRIPGLLDRDYRVAKQTGDTANALVDEDGTISPDDGTVALNTHMEVKPTTATASQSTTYLALIQSPDRAAQVIRDLIEGNRIPSLMNRAITGIATQSAFTSILAHCARSGGEANRVSFGTNAANFAAAGGGLLTYAKIKAVVDKSLDNNLPGQPILVCRGKVISDGEQIVKPVTNNASSKPALFITENGVLRFDNIRVVQDNTLPTDFTGAITSNAFARDASAGTKYNVLMALHTDHLRVGVFSPLRIEEERLPRSQKVHYVGSQSFGFGRRYDIAEVCVPDVQEGIA